MTVKKKGLGRGLDALLRSSESQETQEIHYRDVAVELIHASSFQPRTHFDQEHSKVWPIPFERKG